MPVAPPDRNQGRSGRQRPRVRVQPPPKRQRRYTLPQTFQSEAAAGQGYPRTPAIPPAAPQRGRRYTLPTYVVPRGDAGHRVTPSQQGAINRGVRDQRVAALRHPAPVAPYHLDQKAYLALAHHQQQLQAQRLAPALTVLENTVRPLHAIAAGTRAGIEGRNIPSAALRGLQLKDKTTFSDVLGELGVHGLAKGIGGFVGDVLLDPTTYLTGGTVSVARTAARKEALKATEAALARGATKKIADREGRAAASRALKTESNRGLSVGFGPLRTSGRTTAKIDRALHLDKAAERVRAGLPGRLAQHVNPRVRPSGVSPEDFNRIRSALRRGRAVAAQGEHRARNVAQAVARALPGDNHAKVIDALESRSLAGLTPQEAQVTKALAHEYDSLYRAERAHGLVGRKFSDFGYFPRRPISELERGGSARRLSGAKLASSKARTNRQPYAAFRGGPDDIYTQNAAVATYLRGRDSAIKLGRKQVIDELHGISRAYHPGAHLGPHDGIYVFHRDKMPEEVTGHELDRLVASNSGKQLAAIKATQRARARGASPDEVQALAEKAAAETPEYRVLNRQVVNVATQHVPERLTGLEEIGRIWDRAVQGRVKTILTVPNPQYHLTNLYGDLYNAYLAQPIVKLAHNFGISAQALAWKARREAAAKTLGKQVDPASRGVRIGGQRVGLDELIMEAERHGAIGQGFIGRDLAEVLDSQGKEAAQRLGQGKIARRTRATQAIAKSKVGSRVLHPIDAIRDLSQYREDAVRLATYLGARKRGLTPDQAAAHAAAFHFDYGDLTQFERSVLRRVLPFYTFTARNTPLQIRSLLERPGKIANFEKAREEAAKAIGLQPGWEGALQPWEQEGQPIPVGRNKDGTPQLLYLKLPSTDLRRLNLSTTDQSNYLLSMLTPVIKAPIEYTQNYNFFFRSKIDELLDQKDPFTGEQVRTLRPAPEWLVARLPATARDALHIRRYKPAQAGGKEIWGWPAKLDYLLKQTPLSGTALQFGTGAPNTRGQSSGQRFFGWVSGLKIAPLDPNITKQRNVGAEYGFLQAKAKAMRTQGDAYDAQGNRTPAYQKVLDQTRAAATTLGISAGRKKPSSLDPHINAALQGLPKSSTGVDPAVQAALEGLKP